MKPIKFLKLAVTGGMIRVTLILVLFFGLSLEAGAKIVSLKEIIENPKVYNQQEVEVKAEALDILSQKQGCCFITLRLL